MHLNEFLCNKPGENFAGKTSGAAIITEIYRCAKIAGWHAKAKVAMLLYY
jgi:hypothetical protein